MRGKLTIAIVVALGLMAAAAAWWQAWSRGHRALQLWGHRSAQQIRLAERVELFWRADPERDAASVAAPDELPSALVTALGTSQLACSDISRARGLVHMRQALIEDASYRWQQSPARPPVWQYGLRFSGEGAPCTLLLDLKAEVIGLLGEERPAMISPIADGLRTFLAEQIENARRQESKTSE